MLHKIDHVGIAVTDIEEAIKTYQGLGFKLTGRERIDSQKVETAFFQIGESSIELIAATEPESLIAKFIRKNAGKGGLQQLAITVTNIEAELDRLRKKGLHANQRNTSARCSRRQGRFCTSERYRRRAAGVVRTSH